MKIRMIDYKTAEKEIEKYFEYCGYDKYKISRDLVMGFVEMCNGDYGNWIKDMLNCYFNDNNQKFENPSVFH